MFCHIFFCSHKFNKIVNYFIFEMVEKKNLGSFSKNYRTFYSKICHQPLKNIDLGSGIRKKPIPDPGLRIRVQGSKRHRIPDPDPQH
jgi:hypothetical protein